MTRKCQAEDRMSDHCATQDGCGRLTRLILRGKALHMADFTTMKTTPTALRLLRLIATATGRKQYEVLNQLLEEEAKRLSLPLEMINPQRG